MLWIILLVIGLAIGGGALALSLGQLLKQIWTVRLVVRKLRRLSPAKLKQALDTFEDVDVRDYLASLVNARGVTHHHEGPVERFGFSSFDRQENAWFFAIACATALLGIVVAIGLPPSAHGWRVVSVVLAVVSLVFVVLLDRRGRRLQRIFEVSAFGLAEVLWNGAVRRLQWNERLTLLNRRWHRRIEIMRIGARQDPIVIPYAIAGFDRAIELILERGGFEPAKSST